MKIFAVLSSFGCVATVIAQIQFRIKSSDGETCASAFEQRTGPPILYIDSALAGQTRFSIKDAQSRCSSPDTLATISERGHISIRDQCLYFDKPAITEIVVTRKCDFDAPRFKLTDGKIMSLEGDYCLKAIGGPFGKGPCSDEPGSGYAVVVQKVTQ